MPDILSRALGEAKLLFHEGEAEIEKIYNGAVAVIPGLKATVDADVASAKQILSNAIAWGDTELASHTADATSMVESAADTLIMGLTHGAGAPALPLVNVGVAQGFQILHKALHLAEAAFYAQAKLPPPQGQDGETVAQPGAGG